jgi:hypothetical protein
MTTILEKTTGLVAFVRTIESGSFSAASRLAGSSQSAISKSVAALERRLGVKLIQRSTRTLSLTAEGQAYYASGSRRCCARSRMRKTWCRPPPPYTYIPANGCSIAIANG